MNGVTPPPMIVGGQREHASNAADPMVGRGVAEERAVSTIVLDHEQAKEKSRRRKEKKSVKPVQVKMQRDQHREPGKPERRNRRHELKQAPPVIRPLIDGQPAAPACSIGEREFAIGMLRQGTGLCGSVNQAPNILTLTQDPTRANGLDQAILASDP